MGITFDKEQDKSNLSIFTKRWVANKDAEIIGEGLNGVSNNELVKLFRVEE